MKTIDMQQGSSQWLNFRRKRITATDASVILGVNPYKTLDDLIDEKVYGKETTVTPRMQRGKDLESLALSKFETDVGGLYMPAVVIHQDYDWCMASLDGLEIDEEFQVEIKCPGKTTHNIAKQGEIPPIYYPQIQHQLACTGLPFSYYYSFVGCDECYEGIVIKVERDNDYINEMLEKEFEFYSKYIVPQDELEKIIIENGFF